MLVNSQTELCTHVSCHNIIILFYFVCANDIICLHPHSLFAYFHIIYHPLLNCVYFDTFKILISSTSVCILLCSNRDPSSTACGLKIAPKLATAQENGHSRLLTMVSVMSIKILMKKIIVSLYCMFTKMLNFLSL